MTGYRLVSPIPDAERDAAIEVAEAMLQPAPEAAIARELGRLRLLTVSRDIGQDLTLMLAAYVDELRAYPGDAVRDVLRGWAGRFWPSWDELRRELDRITTPRRALLDALKRGYQPTETEPSWRPPTAAEKAAVAALLGEYRDRERPVEVDPAARNRAVREESRQFTLPPADDPRVRARLREMGVEA